jgi:PEP-CTERM motif
MTSFRARVLWIAVVIVCIAVGNAQAANVVNNGGFESGLSGWTRADQLGSEGTFALQTGTTSPVNADPVPAPPGGATAAMSDAQGPGSHVLYQDIVIPAVVPSATLSFDVFVGNRAGTFFTPTPSNLDFSTPALNQQARVDILAGGTDPFTVAGLQNAFQTIVGDPPVSGYTHHTLDVTSLLNAHLSQTLRLRFAEVDNVFTFQLGVDNVALDVGASQTVPEPASWVLMVTAGLALAWRQRRRGASRRIS